MRQSLSNLTKRCKPSQLVWSINKCSLALGSLNDAGELLCQHHVALDLQLATHESLHAIEFAIRHRQEISIGHRDGAVSTWSLAEPCISVAALQIHEELDVGVTDDKLENGTSLLDESWSIGLDGLSHLF